MGNMHANNNFNEAEVLAQLDKLLLAPGLKSSKVLRNFLRFIVLEKLSGREHELKEYNIAVKGLRRGEDFNPQHFSLIRIYAFRLRKILRTYYEGPGLLDPIRISIPKGSYRPVFQLNHLLDDSSIKHKVIAGKGEFIAVAIFPFVSMDKTQVYSVLIDKLCEQVSEYLSEKSDIKTLSYILVKSYVSHVNDVRRAGADLAVNVAVTGSVRFELNMLLIRLQLIAAATGIQLWMGDFEYKLQMQSIESIAREIADAIYNALFARPGKG
ncbi:hypothetical protein [Deminuibacter soli]|uniref:Uncharacterized protein n=1 Tax=Deminuibacter soli TaxID=2291815 RepID=A0A3E1NH85_9BACT|nr:hypothetical protein [Deminuibacter soli]RFM27295.1 hypothetical protein DXN05_14805 [Deminuibacter soli]